MISHIYRWGCQELFLDMIVNSAGEEESDGELIISKRASHDVDEVRNLFFVLALIKSIYDNDCR